MSEQTNSYTVGDVLYRAEARVWKEGGRKHVDVVFTLWKVDRVTACGAWLVEKVNPERHYWSYRRTWRKSGGHYARRTREDAISDLCIRTRHRTEHAARQFSEAFAMARKLVVECPLEHLGDSKCHHNPRFDIPRWGQ